MTIQAGVWEITSAMRILEIGLVTGITILIAGSMEFIGKRGNKVTTFTPNLLMRAYKCESSGYRHVIERGAPPTHSIMALLALSTKSLFDVID
jgi:hypothetical protein